MVQRSDSTSYRNLHPAAEEPAAWYWRFIALAASWMILAGYLILPGLYAKDNGLKISTPVLNVFVVALLTAGYSFTALLCFACRNHVFQAESIFLPALTSSAIGLLTIAYNFLASHAYIWGTAAISGTVISTTSTLLYAMLLLWTHRRIVKNKEAANPHATLWSELSYYTNFNANMYPSASRSPSAPPPPPINDDDKIKQQMARLLMNHESAPISDAASATFKINLPEDREMGERIANSQELVGTPPPQAQQQEWIRNRTEERPDSLGETQAWARWQERGRPTNRPSSVGAHSTHSSRELSREERRREIEHGHIY
ncbi:hypothetical protein P280DRAFT_424824 [Massarina eburnea CBS 473.64]|uniref:Uncharacterized protein n=1 Tax=Massarina eburnea CBS 473.64 TaxID=1395130 RepID=A0A6A6S5T7_9PLEO|nr:hypothetical protein P280DRAFT_424824 [Massarina eburnea CBS 473.64]